MVAVGKVEDEKPLEEPEPEAAPGGGGSGKVEDEKPLEEPEPEAAPGGGGMAR